jgi:glycosyltransferase involved in cell wall biosynthesis
VDKAERLLRDLQPDIIHTHQTGALWYLGQAAQRVRGIAVLHTEHSDHVAHAKSWKQKLKTRLLWRRTAKWAGQFCCVSEDIALSVRRWGTVPARDVDVVLNGIDTELYRRQSGRTETRQQLNIPADAKVIGTVGRLVEVKRQDQLIRAFSELVRRFQTQPSFSPSGLRLLIVGDGSERQALERLAVELGIAEWVVFAGYQARPERFYQAMDVFALSSRHEGLPLALLEAWAASVPVVVPAVGGLAKVVSDGQTGLLFSRGDETALALKLEQLLKDEAYSGRLAAAGAELVERQYSVDRMVDEYELRYRRLIAAA